MPHVFFVVASVEEPFLHIGKGDILISLGVLLLVFAVLMALVLFYCRTRVKISQRRLRRALAILAALGVRTAVVDADGNYLFYHFRGSNGRLPRSRKGTRNNPELLPENRALTRRVLDSGVPVQQNFSIEGDSFRSEVSPLPLDLYQRPAALWTTYNVTDFLVARQELAEYTSYLTETLDAVSDGIVFFDEKGNVSYVNRMMASFGGYQKSECIGKTVGHLVENRIPGQLERTIEAVKEVLLTGRSALHIDDEAHRPDGTMNYYNCSAKPLRDPSGKITGAAMIVRQTNMEHSLREALKKECDSLTRVAREHEKTIENLNNYIEYAQIFSNSLAHLLSLTDLTHAMDSVLATAGRVVKADRAYVFQYSDDGKQLSNTHEWTADGIAPEKEHLQNLPASDWARWTRIFESHKVLIIDDIDDPAMSEAEKSFLKVQSIRSLIVIGITMDGVLRGFVGLDFVRSKRSFSYLDEQIMRDIANLLVCVLERGRYLTLRKTKDA